MTRARTAGATRAGALVISLDFELRWGVADTRPLNTYRRNLRGVRTVVPALLDLFLAHGIHATWATVGLLFFGTRPEMVRALPAVRPAYANPRLSAYGYLAEVGEDEDADPDHFGRALLDCIEATPHQEIGTHTFSHYYVGEPGAGAESFRADLKQALEAGRARGVEIRSIVFPRNQTSGDALRACAEAGLLCYRANPASPLYASGLTARTGYLVRALRMLDGFVPLVDCDVAVVRGARPDRPASVPATRRLRPWKPRERLFHPLHLRRVRRGMTRAARAGGVYHLWWHPHDFGAHPAQNLAAVAELLEHFSRLRGAFGMESLTMAEAAERATHPGREAIAAPKDRLDTGEACRSTSS